jgi:hypothetical protein
VELIKSYKHWASNCKVLKKLGLRWVSGTVFWLALSIVANPEGWFCQVRKIWVVAQLKFEESAVIGNLALEELRR